MSSIPDRFRHTPQGETDYLVGHSADVLTEANLSSLYGVPLKRVVFEHGGRQIETLAPVLS